MSMVVAMLLWGNGARTLLVESVLGWVVIMLR